MFPSYFPSLKNAENTFWQFFQLPLASANGKSGNSPGGFSHIIIPGPTIYPVLPVSL
jgi:hypothetical protein